MAMVYIPRRTDEELPSRTPVENISPRRTEEELPPARSIEDTKPRKAVMSDQVAEFPANDLQGKAVIDANTGEKIGSIGDILFDPQSLNIAALLVFRGTSGLENLFSRATDAIQAEHVRVWGKDVVLVDGNRTTAIEELTRGGELVKLSDQLKGRYVVSTNGERVGQIDDALIDPQGRLAGYQLSQVYIEGPLEESRRIPVGATYSLGKDVLIVDMSRL